MITVVATRHGDARLHISEVANPRFRLVLHHGAGKGVDSPDLAHIASRCENGIVICVEQPWKVAGKKIASSPRILDEAFLDIELPYSHLPLLVGGRSAGARVACRTADQVGAKGLFLLAFPLHPPGKPEKSRLGEIPAHLPRTLLQGEHDPFGRPEEFPPGWAIPVKGAGHDLGDLDFAPALERLCQEAGIK